jgi:hypothetical protein
VTEHGDHVVSTERSRAHQLLSVGELGVEWREERVVPDPASLGALDGFRLVSDDAEVRLNIYVYAEWGQGAAAGAALEEMVDGDVYYAGSTINGRLLCFAVTSTGSERGRRLVDDALGAFAGWE